MFLTAQLRGPGVQRGKRDTFVTDDHRDIDLARASADTAVHLVIGLIQTLAAKGVLSSQEVEMIFDSALVSMEAQPLGAASAGTRLLLESTAAALRAALPRTG